MALDFGKLKSQAASNATPSVIQPIPRHIENVTKSGPLSFDANRNHITGRQDLKEQNVLPAVSELKGPTPKITTTRPKGQLDFGDLPSDQVTAAKIPTNIGIGNAAGQITSAAGAVEATRQLSPLANIAPSYSLNPIIPMEKSQTEILEEVKQRCANQLLNELDKIDPSLRLIQLLDRAKELCSLANFTDLRNVIEQIQKTKRDLVLQALSNITDPLSRITKMNDMIIDAINTKSNELLQDLAGMLKFEQFDNLLSGLNSMNPRDAIAMLNSEILKYTELRNFKKVRELLDAVQIVKAQLQQVENFTNAAFEQLNRLANEPDKLVDAVQSKIREALNLNNYEDIRNALDAYDSLQQNIAKLIAELDPKQALAKLTTLANEALKELDMGKYYRILDELAAKLCTGEIGVLPTIPNVPQVTPQNLPSIVR